MENGQRMVLQDVYVICDLEQYEEAWCYGMDLLIYISGPNIYDSQTVVIEDAKMLTKEARQWNKAIGQSS